MDAILQAEKSSCNDMYQYWTAQDNKKGIIGEQRIKRWECVQEE